MTGQCTAFHDNTRIAQGTRSELVASLRGRENGLMVFEDATGRIVDLDWRGEPEAVEAAPPPRKRGRPKLGVVPREVTLGVAEQPARRRLARPAPARRRCAQGRWRTQHPPHGAGTHLSLPVCHRRRLSAFRRGHAAPLRRRSRRLRRYHRRLAGRCAAIRQDTSATP